LHHERFPNNAPGNKGIWLKTIERRKARLNKETPMPNKLRSIRQSQSETETARTESEKSAAAGEI
jgi:hypothetical protein